MLSGTGKCIGGATNFPHGMSEFLHHFLNGIEQGVFITLIQIDSNIQLTRSDPAGNIYGIIGFTTQLFDNYISDKKPHTDAQQDTDANRDKHNHGALFIQIVGIRCTLSRMFELLIDDFPHLRHHFFYDLGKLTFQISIGRRSLPQRFGENQLCYLLHSSFIFWIYTI